MYKNFYYSRYNNTCHLWSDGQHGDPLYQKFIHEPYAYQIDPKGEYKTLTGLKVKKVTSWSKESEKKGMIFEHDVPVPTRVLIDNYFESDEPSIGHNILFFDIEVEKGLRYSSAKDALNTITSIAYYFNGSYTVLLLDRENLVKDCIKDINSVGKVTINTFDTEYKLLHGFLMEWNKINPTIISAYNGDYFDVPYIVNRMNAVLGQALTKKLSPIGVIEKRTFGKDTFIKIAGITQMDYLQLYKKFTQNEESSYSLEAISQKELKRGKMKYEGTLDDLYNTDIDGFIEYNVNDVELMVALDKKMDLIEIARGICHKGHVPYDDFQFSSRYLDGALLSYCKQTGFVAFSTDKSGTHEKAEGAFVKPPKVGIYKFCYDLDLESEYPNNIKTLNISPETKWGKVHNFNIELFAKNSDIQYDTKKYKNQHISDQLFESDDAVYDWEFNISELREFLTKNNLSISSAGIIYSLDKKGIIPTILTVWGDDRTKFRKQAKEFHDAGDHDKFVSYDRKQSIQKILLNSLYGVLLLPSFRFYDRENGESTTLTGQTLVQWSAMVGNTFYQKQMKSDTYIDYCIYQDTDSCFFEALPLINHRYSADQFTEAELVDKTLEIAKEVETLVNKSYTMYAQKYHNVSNHTWRIKQEMVGKRAFWGQAKKRYAMSIINKNGMIVDELEIKGFDVVRSSFPKTFRKMMKEVIVDVLDDKNADDLNTKVRKFNSEYKKSSIFDIMLPSGVKEISKFKNGQKGTPIHVKSAQNYNQLLKLFDIQTIPPIQDGDKIVYAYVKQNPYGFETMALKGQGEDDPELVEFVQKFIDKEKVFSNTLISKLNTIWGDLGWGEVQLSEPNNFF